MSLEDQGQESSRMLLSQQFALQQRIEDMNVTLSLELEKLRSDVNRSMGNLNSSVKRLANQPALRIVRQRTSEGQQNSSQDQHARVATLSKGPRDLYVLWQEYEFGIEGRKPAKLFTRRERGRQKSKYCRWKAFWDLGSRLISKGHSSDAAIYKIYSIYGRSLSVTAILQRFGREKGGSLHPELRG